MKNKVVQLTNNLEQEEIAKFEAIASNWWNKEGVFKLLHLINPLRLNYILNRSGDLFNKKILDVGCGGGILAENMAKRGAIVTGLDMGFKQLQIACLHAIKSDIQVNYIHETVENHAKEHAQQYDIITCMEMLEHVPNPQSVVNACAQLVKPNGEVFFSTINRNVKAFLTIIVAAEYILNIIPKGTHNIKKFIKPAELLNWVDHTSLKERHITGIHYNPLTGNSWIGPGISVNYMVHCIVKNTSNI